MTRSASTAVRTGLLVLLGVVLQISGFAQIEVLGASPDLTPLIVAATTTRMRRSVADNCTNDDEYQVGSAEARGFRTVSRDTMTIHDDRWMPLVRMRE